MAKSNLEIRVGVFETIDEVESVLQELRDAGLSEREISVVCSDESKAEHFARYVHEEPAGAHSNEALTAAGAAGLGLGTAVVLATVLTTAGTAVFAVGAFAGLAAVGTFAALMSTRGAEKELADYYDQAVVHGKLLVAVETADQHKLRAADAVLARHGAEQQAELPLEDPALP